MRVCPSCGAKNPDEARFCMSCASALAQPAASHEIRKSVTVVFCDRYAETERLAREGVEQLRELGEHGYPATSLIYLADAIVSQDRPDVAEAALKEAQGQAAEDDAVTVIGIRRVRAKVLRSLGDRDGAERSAREAVASGATTDYLFEKGSSHQVLGEILVAKGERGEGLEQLRVALDLFEREGVLVLLDALRARIEEAEAG